MSKSSEALAGEIKLHRVEEFLWEIPRQGGMRVPGRIFATEKLLADLKEDNSLRQVMNVAHLPGIVGYSLAMPDIHWGYGFPIGGVAAVDLNDGVCKRAGGGRVPRMCRLLSVGARRLSWLGGVWRLG